MSDDRSEEVDRLIADYLDERLTGEALAAFDRRVTSDPTLARRLAEHLLLEVDLHTRRSGAPAATTQLQERRAAPRPRSAPRRTRPVVRWWPAALAAAALLAVVVVAWPRARASNPDALVAVVSTHSGAELEIDGVAGGTHLAPGQMLRTRQPVELRWPREATTATIIPGNGAAQVRLDRHGLTLIAGAVDAVVAPRAADAAFRINVGDAIATVLGTRLRLERDGARALLTVASGRVELRQGAAVGVVTAGGSAVADVNGVRVTTADSVNVERGLLARWSGDGLSGSHLRDLGPAGHHGQVGNVRVVPGRMGQALAFSEESRAIIPHTPALAVGDPAQAFTIALWLRVPGPVTREQTLLAKGRTTAVPGPTLAIALLLSPGERFDVYRWHDSPAAGAPNLENSHWQGVSFADGTWHHLAVVCENASARRCYRDGIDQGLDQTPWRNDTRNETRWTLGRVENMGFTDESPFTGELEDVRLYDRALSAAEIAALAGRR